MNSFLVCVVLAASCALTASASPTSYDFAYGVNDPSTGDAKEQQESRSGDLVSGHYKTLDADGLTRTVVYKSDPITGFQAHVSRQWSPDGGAVAAPVFPRPAYPFGAPIVRSAPYAGLRSAALVRPQYAPAPYGVPRFTAARSYGGY